MHSIFRRATYELLKKQTLNGSIIDLGGGKTAEYPALIQGTFKITSINIGVQARPDIIADLENPLLPDLTNKFDGAILMNVLEHVYNYKQLLEETFRILKTKGDLLIVVPFLFPIHPSPNDFHRFTSQSLERLLTEINFTEIKITPIAPGILKARHLMIERHFPHALGKIFGLPVAVIISFFDNLLTKFAATFSKNYNPNHYPLGYLITAKKTQLLFNPLVDQNKN
jgi:SAM-dependent methyltransferase